MKEIWESVSVVLISPTKDTLSLLVWCVFLAALAVWMYLIYRRATFGKAILALLEKGCDTPETAKTAGELGKKLSPKALEGQDRLIEKSVSEGKETRYFIPEDRRKKAEYFLKASGSKPWQIVLGILGLYAVLVAAYYLLPGLLEGFGIQL